MGEFDERLRRKNRLEEDGLEAAVRDLAGAATGQAIPEHFSSGMFRLYAAVKEQIGRAHV